MDTGHEASVSRAGEVRGYHQRSCYVGLFAVAFQTTGVEFGLELPAYV
jgi:hypothetical protein